MAHWHRNRAILCWWSAAGWLLAVYATCSGEREAVPLGVPGGTGGVSGRWVGGTARRPLIGQPPEAARLRATRAMPLAHWLTCLAGRYAVPFLVWSTMGEARKASRPWGSMK
jgi:hypothetical protein